MAMVSRAQTTISAPTSAVLNSARSTNQSTSVVANTAQPAARAPAATTINASVTASSTGSDNAVTGAAATGNTANNGTQNLNVFNGGNSSATIDAAAIDSGNASQADNNSQTAGPLYGIYRVQSGDYLGKIAQTYGTTVDALRSINNITGSIIEIDQEILYPLPAN